MDTGSVLQQALVYLAAAVVAVPIAKRLGLGSVLGYLLAGVAIGPFGLGLVGTEGEDVMHFAEFGVVMMLFLVGLELQPALLWRMRGPIVGLGGLQVGLTTAAITGILIALGWSWQAALAVGLTLALSSTAIVLQSLDEKGLMPTEAGQRSFAVLLFQDIAVIPILALLPLLALHDAHGDGHAAKTWTDGLAPWAAGLVVIGAVAAVVLLGRYLVRPALRTIARTELRELFTAAALLLVAGIALLMMRVGLSPALGTFLAGVVLADSEYRHELESDIEPFKGLLLGLFFIAVGCAIDFGMIADRPGEIAVWVLGLIAIKLVVLATLARLFGLGVDQGLIFTVALAQGGEFAFVLFSFATQNGVLTSEQTAPLIAVVALSMAATPLMLRINESLILPRVGTREADERPADAMDESAPVILAGFGRFGHIVGRLLRANGVEVTVLDRDSDHVDLLRRLGLRVFYGDAARPDLLRAAGADDARLLIVAVDDPDSVLAIVRSAKKHFPHLRILARARGRSHAYELLDEVDDVYRETLDSSLRVGIDALRALGQRGHRATRAARRFRAVDESELRELAKIRGDRERYISRAREMIHGLEQCMLADIDRARAEADDGWDTRSLTDEAN